VVKVENRMRGITVFVSALLLSVAAFAAISNAYTGQTTRVSVVSTTDDPANAAASQGAISANGRYVVFSSQATNLDVRVRPFSLNVFRYDRTTRVTELVNVNRFGYPSLSGDGFSPSVSADGRYVAFASSSSDVVEGDTNGQLDVFVRDMQAGVTRLASASSAGVQGDQLSGFSGTAGARALSDDGRYVVFNSGSTTFVPGPNNGKQQIYLKDMTTGTLVRVSVDAGGAAGNDNSSFGVISGDGKSVAFRSESSNFSELTLTHSSQIYVRDLVAGTTTLESVTTAGVVNLSAGSSTPALSFNGNFVAFESSARLDPRDLDNGTLDVFLRDRSAHTTVLASLSNNAIGGAFSRNAAISGDGRYVGFMSLDDKLVFGDVGGFIDVFVYDRLTEALAIASRNDAGEQANNSSFSASLSFDGGLVLFQSQATNLVSRPAPGGAQLYVRSLLANQAPVVNGGADETVLEGTWLKRFGTFSDFDGSTSWTGTVDYGMGSVALNVDPVTKTWFFQFAPLAPGTYVVTISITDNQGATGSATFRHTVTNVAPVIVGLTGDEFLYFGSMLHRQVILGDPGMNWPVPQPAETYSATVDYGDGTGVTTFSGTSFWLDHTYANADTYVVTVTESDSNGGVSSAATLTVHVFKYTYAWLDPVGDMFVVGRNLPVKFTVRDSSGSFVLDQSVVVDVVDPSGNVVAGPYYFGDQPSRSVTASGDAYHVNVDTKALAPGMYWLRVRFSSPTVTGEFRLGTTGTAAASASTGSRIR
jgi:Tol biopolymer transport system component